MDIFTEISLILAIAFVVSAIMRILKQPLIIGYIMSGLIVGPYFLGILKSTEVISLFSQLGITALLFVVGLGLSPKVLRELGLSALLIGLGQVFLTSLLGYFVAYFLGFTHIESIYIGLAFAFSSTIIILKLFSDKGDLNTLHSRLAIGILLVQDLVATLVLVIITSVSSVDAASNILHSLLIILLKGFVLLIVLFAVSGYILPKLTNFIAKSQEFLFISSLAWGMGISALYHYFGLSVEIGALVAGVTLSMTPYSHEISSRFKPLRDFFVILFFIMLGFHMVLSDWHTLLVPTLVFCVFVVLMKPLIVFVLMNLSVYSRRTSFLAGLSMAQISEFSLILISLGYSVGHLSNRVPATATFVGIATIGISTYLIMYGEKIFKAVSKILPFLEIRKVKNRKKESPLFSYDALLFGYRRVGAEFAKAFKETGNSFLVIDYNPLTIKRLEERNIHCEYGDADDVEFLHELPFNEVKFVVSTISDNDANLLLVKHTRMVNPRAIVLVVADKLDQAEELYAAGATHVVMPHYLGAQFAAEMLMENQSDADKHNKLREEHINHIKELREVSFENLV